ncbi:MAG TPA: hypothetical protein VK890_07070 [Bacteroidia bacterium]|nr:hypothetical protein [Bacteroidia bacterium]
MNRRPKRVLVLLAIPAIWLMLSFAEIPPTKIAVVDVYIQTFVINGHPVNQFTDEKGATHISNKVFYLNTVDKGTMGGPVRYRFFLEHVNLTSPESKDSLPKYVLEGPPVFAGSKAEMIDSASVAAMAPEIFSQLPATFTNPRHSN